MRAVTIPLLPSADIDESVRFYEALGFRRTYRQMRPNPHAVVELGEIGIHLFGIEGFDPASSYGSCLLVVADPDALYAEFAAGLRGLFGKLPVSGIPRILRPRKKQGTVRGFSVVDPGGNWLRVSRLGDSEESANEESTGLARVVLNASRLGDAHGDELGARRLLLNGLERFPEAETIDRVKALLYLAELQVRLGEREQAGESFARAMALAPDAAERDSIAGDIEHTRELVAGA